MPVPACTAHDLTEILWGTAGVGCLMLSLGEDYLGPAGLELAVRAGDWLLTQAEQAPPGIRWSLGRGYEARRPGGMRRFPNFAHGTAGIGFFLARLAQVTGEARFRDASLAGTEWIMTTVRTGNDTCAAYHHDPGGTELFTLGWCHGPPGLGWLFRQMELTTGAAGWRSWVRRAARADLISGIPERREPGFWDNVARCCGSAGVAEFFLDLHRLEGQPADLAFAVTLVRRPAGPGDQRPLGDAVVEPRVPPAGAGPAAGDDLHAGGRGHRLDPAPPAPPSRRRPVDRALAPRPGLDGSACQKPF